MREQVRPFLRQQRRDLAFAARLLVLPAGLGAAIDVAADRARADVDLHLADGGARRQRELIDGVDLLVVRVDERLLDRTSARNPATGMRTSVCFSGTSTSFRPSRTVSVPSVGRDGRLVVACAATGAHTTAIQIAAGLSAGAILIAKPPTIEGQRRRGEVPRRRLRRSMATSASRKMRHGLSLLFVTALASAAATARADDAPPERDPVQMPYAVPRETLTRGRREWRAAFT